ncbi:T9SS type A sorting domain-containing protein [Flavobacterium cerinum]|uniref:T9SS type A sorting domain-containing protein n=1 Tax=Flavobacterium cerinum TaxID=2502784 RepID=A0ABY5IML7_9FLAO|nr:T9SS type A sorting domain-containing protein [Flavobacterium cerinum]UUC44035.1 T9SS type A sorting domain-containing protein [Flavobacterium cerinum]
MKTITFICVLFFASLVAEAQVTLTQSLSQEIGNHTHSCIDTLTTTSRGNKYYRHFKLNEMGVTGEFNLHSVQFGIQTLLMDAQSFGFIVHVRVYRTNADFPAGYPNDGYTLLKKKMYPVTIDDIGKIVNVPLDVVVPSGNNLVVEIGYNGPKTKGKLLILGSNASGETGISYFSSNSCGIPSPVNINTVKAGGTPDSNLVLNLIGVQTLANPAFSQKSDQVIIYPNPTSGSFKVTMPEGIRIKNIDMMDVNGRKFTVKAGSDGEVDISGFINGVYFLSLETNYGILVKKIIKQ